MDARRFAPTSGRILNMQLVRDDCQFQIVCVAIRLIKFWSSFELDIHY